MDPDGLESAAAREVGTLPHGVRKMRRGAVSTLPFTSSAGWGSISVEGVTPAPGQEPQGGQRAATADYFRMMTIPLAWRGAERGAIE